MGILDSVLNNALSSIAGGNGGSQNQALQLAMQLIEQNGGLGKLLQQLQQGGLGDILQSWIGQGGNQAVSAKQLESALGVDLEQAARQVGLDRHQAGDLLSQYLPQIIDGLTPNGTAADADGFGLDDIARLLMQNFLK
ncbi:MAG: YidB family protein [Eikenella sp.]|nr:YidB family protein [Eikenella sp.]